jgi:hypothetical protein
MLCSEEHAAKIQKIFYLPSGLPKKILFLCDFSRNGVKKVIF